MEKKSDKLSDEELLQLCRGGDRKSLESLVERYRNFIYNVSVRMTLNDQDAADITQEVLIKVITKLDSFKGDSSFKTWLYRIMVNHILNHKKAEARRKFTFKGYGQTLDDAPDLEINSDDSYHADKLLLVEETKQTCMTGMLLCMEKKPRLVFILGELFGVNDKVGGEIMSITPEHFRVILSRTKKELYNFMHQKCGLVNKNNPCRCANKTKAFIQAGFVNPETRRFTSGHYQTIEKAAAVKQLEMEDFLAVVYRTIFLNHSYLEGPDFIQSLKELLSSEKMIRIFNLKQNNKS
jgi:RNA polymerase sigma factor (sigma-70 family)